MRSVRLSSWLVNYLSGWNAACSGLVSHQRVPSVDSVSAVQTACTCDRAGMWAGNYSPRMGPSLVSVAPLHWLSPELSNCLTLGVVVEEIPSC